MSDVTVGPLTINYSRDWLALLFLLYVVLGKNSLLNKLHFMSSFDFFVLNNTEIVIYQ